jgi:transcriptional regulator with XRE-family HTH domain
MNDGNISAGAVGVNKLREIRKAAGLTQVQLCQQSNVSRFRLCMAEANCLELRPNELDAINQALKPELERAARLAAEFSGCGLSVGENNLSKEKPPVGQPGEERNRS